MGKNLAGARLGGREGKTPPVRLGVRGPLALVPTCQNLEVIDADLEGYREEKEPGGSEDTRREKNRDRKYRFIISMPPIHPLLLSYNTKSRTMLSLEIVITSLKTRLRR
jgi:hypothetical protein